MKSLAILVLAMAVSGALQAQYRATFSSGYGMMLPTGSMKPNIRMGHGANVNVLFSKPDSRVAAGFEFNVTGYGHTTKTEEYVFPDGMVAPAQICITNSYMTFMGVTRLYIVSEGPVRPFASIRGGYAAFRTNLGIFDPDDSDSCEPLESSLLSKDGTFAYSAGGGVRIDLGLPFKKLERNRYFVEFSSNMIQGGQIKYMSENAPSQNNGSHNGLGRAEDVEAPFINTATTVVHPHHVGYLYTSFLQAMDLRIDFSVKLN